MTREEAIKLVEVMPTGLFQQDSEDKKHILQIVTEFEVQGVNLRGSCPNCWQDAVLVLRNFFGVTSNDTDGDGNPDTPSKWRYLRSTPMLWRGYLIDGTTPDDIVDEFVKWHPQFFEAVEDETAEDGGGK